MKSKSSFYNKINFVIGFDMSWGTQIPRKPKQTQNMFVAKEENNSLFVKNCLVRIQFKTDCKIHIQSKRKPMHKYMYLL